MPAKCVHKQVYKATIRIVEDINENVKLVEITGEAQHIMNESIVPIEFVFFAATQDKE